ncbi:MAG: SDR family oxidoreductase [Chloroflexota bacterium]|nr:SDR family oxidoreductase [Chloroflexota bacterium]MDE2910608.1 SDR family oxidoreductase [Chloroflexota bacterium]
MTYSLAGKVVIITGASSGIGAGAARLLAEQGCKLVLAARSVDKLEALAAQLPGESLVARADMTVPADIENMIAQTRERFGRIDALFANAGIFIHGDFAANAISDISDMLMINVDAVMRCAHAVIPVMKAQGAGDIIVTSSVAGHEKLHGGPAYGATKHAIETFVNTLRRQVAGDGIRVMSLAPARVANELWNLTDADEIEKVTVGDEHYLKVEDVAEAALYMLSRPRHVTIRNLVIIAKQQDV